MDNFVHSDSATASWAAWQAMGYDAHGTWTADPLFSSLSGLDLHLTSASPAAHAGANLSSYFTSDKDGKARPSGTTAWDIGAYQYCTSNCKAGPIVAPTAPAIVNSPTPAQTSTLVNGSCSVTLNQCTSGTFSDVTDTSANHLWSCLGSNGGITASCSLPINSAANQPSVNPLNPIIPNLPITPFTPTIPIIPTIQTVPTNPNAPIVPSGPFTRALSSGSSGLDVKTLQKFLNAHGFPIAFAGTGSPGNESSSFGSATKAALARFQAYYGIDLVQQSSAGSGVLGQPSINTVNAILGTH